MAMADAMRLAFERMFDHIHRELGSPSIYAVPFQTPSGLTYDADLDAWVDDSGSVPDPALYSLTMYGIPALWGADADNLILNMGGVVTDGDLVAIAKAAYQSQIDGAMMVRTGSQAGDKYNVTSLENAPDGGAAVFVVARLRRREA